MCDSIICVSNYVLSNPGLQGDRPLWSRASNKLCRFFRGKKIYAPAKMEKAGGSRKKSSRSIDK